MSFLLALLDSNIMNVFMEFSIFMEWWLFLLGKYYYVAGTQCIRSINLKLVSIRHWRSSRFDALGLVESNKGKALPTVMEAVKDGSTVKVYLLPNFQYVQVYCTGVQVRLDTISV